MQTAYTAAPQRYQRMPYRRCGRSGLLLPAVSLGLWHNFGDSTTASAQREILHAAFDAGITHFDLANNYGVPYGSAERNLGQHLKRDFRPYRDELIISTKAGWDMWPGPYGQGGGSRKYLLASLDQSLQRMGLDYVDVFYSHRYDPDTPLEETCAALASAVQQGKALYVGVSSYPAEATRRAAELLRALGAPALIHQPIYNLLDRWIEHELLHVLHEQGMGCIAFSPLAQGLLSDRYLQGVPPDARVNRPGGHSLPRERVAADRLGPVHALNAMAQARGQTLAQMALAWVLRDARVTSALVGVSRLEHVHQAVQAVHQCQFAPEELAAIDACLRGG